MPTSDRVAPRSAYVSLVLCVIGLGISIYLTYEHYTGNKTLACSENGKVNCAKVTTSQWSHIGGVPVAVFGLIFFVGMTVLCLPWVWRFPQLDALRVLGVIVGIGSALYLVWIELFKVDAICLWCTGVHIITLLLLGAVLWTNSEVRAA
jgi:uncharacterized membrane protein